MPAADGTPYEKELRSARATESRELLDTRLALDGAGVSSMPENGVGMKANSSVIPSACPE